MGKFGKKQLAEEVKAEPLVEAQMKFDEAKEKFDAISNNPESLQEEKDAVKVELDDAEKLLGAIKDLGLEAPAKPSSETRSYFTLSCVYAHGRYPKLGLKFTNGIAVVNTEQYEAAKASKLWNREIFLGTGRANSGSSVKVVQS